MMAQQTEPAAGLRRLKRDGAVLSDCGQYRFLLCRDLGDDRRRVCFIMLNPSTADADVDDPTIRRCKRFVRDWGYGWLDVVNLFPLRTPEPARLWEGLERTDLQLHNRVTIVETAGQAQIVVAAWGTWRHHLFRERRDQLVASLADAGVSLHCLGTCRDGEPRHPLYVRGNATPQPWGAR